MNSKQQENCVTDEVRSVRRAKRCKAASLAVTSVAVALITVSSQYAINRAGIARDLVQTAIQILKEPEKPETTDIRTWAVRTVNNYSDIKLSERAGSQFSRGALVMLHTNPLLKPAMELNRPPCPEIDSANFSQSQKDEVQRLFEICRQNAADRLWLKTFIQLETGVGKS